MPPAIPLFVSYLVSAPTGATRGPSRQLGETATNLCRKRLHYFHASIVSPHRLIGSPLWRGRSGRHGVWPSSRIHAAVAVPQASTATIRYVPDDLRDDSWLQALKAAQIKAIAGVSAFHDFQFTDRVAESGITFKHRIVDDAGKTYKAAHYDHGNGLAIADVDGDGLPDIYFVSQVGGNQLVEESRRRQVRGHHGAAGVAVPGKVSVSASFADIDNDGDAGSLRHHRARRQPAVRERRQGPLQGHLRGVGPDYVGHSSGAVFFDYDSDGRLDLFLVNVGKYTTDSDRRRRLQVLRRLRGCLFRASEAGARRAQHPVPQRGRQPLRGRLGADGPHGHCRGPATQR